MMTLMMFTYYKPFQKLVLDTLFTALGRGLGKN